jgi:transposase, IS6 family
MCDVRKYNSLLRIEGLVNPGGLGTSRVGGKWKYLFRAVDKQGRLIDFDRRNTKAARRFLAKALKVMRTWPPVSITTDKLGSYPKALRRLRREGELKDTVRHRTSKYLNNRIEADHGALKRLIRPTRGYRYRRACQGVAIPAVHTDPH